MAFISVSTSVSKLTSEGSTSAVGEAVLALLVLEAGESAVGLQRGSGFIGGVWLWKSSTYEW